MGCPVIVKIPVPHFSVRCVRCNATAPVFRFIANVGTTEVDIGCTCPNERPELELVFAYPAAHHLPTIPLERKG